MKSAIYFNMEKETTKHPPIARETWDKINHFGNEVDSLDDDITLFQKDFIKYIYFITVVIGKYKHNADAINTKYEAILTKKEISEEIDLLIAGGYISKTLKKTIVNGRYSTIVYLELTFNFDDTLK